jgi:hypothetical protein
MRVGLLGLIATLVVAGPAVSRPRLDRPPPASAGPEAFVRWVYSHYTPTNSSFDSQVAYSPGLKALFARNTRLLRGEVGDNNDSDPVCQCQDWETIRITGLKVISVGAHQAPVEVTFSDGRTHGKLGLMLVRTLAGWRIDDIMVGDRDWDLRARLAYENHELAAAKKRR